MYGVDQERIWYDYDLVSAYTTAMAHLGTPDYQSFSMTQDPSNISKILSEELISNYIIIKAFFNFPSKTKYPSIPCFVDENTTVYPLTGECFLTGAEYLLAKSQGCEIKIQTVIKVPFKRGEKGILKNPPFTEIIKELQGLRREYPKGHILNLLYKEMGNSIYGNVVRGISNRKRFDVKTGRKIRMEATLISNPLLAS
jgi:hypothetical protein